MFEVQRQVRNFGQTAPAVLNVADLDDAGTTSSVMAKTIHKIRDLASLHGMLALAPARFSWSNHVQSS